jgi:hypothetical protein
MNTEDTLSVKYIYGELDPSEEVIFEREISESEDLMIEVESMRETRKRLEKLPLINPPSELSENVLNFLEKKNEKTGQKQAYIYLSVAASILVALFSGGYLFVADSAENQKMESAVSEASGGSSAILNYSNEKPDLRPASPWIDKNDIIYMNDLYNLQTGKAENSVFKNSFEKLTPVDRFQQNFDVNRDFQLTGSRN